MQTAVSAYLAADRRAALAQRGALPARASGTVLSIDVVGFTRITEAFASTLGARRGADALAELLNQVYAALIACVQDSNGSVVSFSGDAMRCWFAADDGRLAFECASCMHQSIREFAAIPLDSNETIAVAVKAAIVSGAVQRLGLGDPSIQIIDTLAGDLLTRLTDLEALVQPGEIIIDEPAALVLSAETAAGSWREHPASPTRGAIVEPAASTSAPHSASAVTPPVMPPADAVRPWVLPGIWEWLHRGMGDVRTELRPAVALFGQFGGAIDQQDGSAISSLNEYVGWVQRVVKRYDGVVLQLTLGEKGNYFYAVFGALLIHEDDALRAVCAARDLQRPPADLAVGADLRVGLASGIMRTGVYGSPLRRTYGVLGDAANLAARLMEHASRNAILASADVAAATAQQVEWIAQESIRVKGKRDPVRVYQYSAARDSDSPGLFARHLLPMAGRQAELDLALGYLDSQPIRGRAIAITGEAGIGKSRMIKEIAAVAGQRGWLVHSGECQSYQKTTPYNVWRPILRAILGITASTSPEQQLARLEAAVAAINQTWLPRLPLLAPVINLAIPDTELTRSLDAQLRSVSREGLVVDWLRGWVQMRQSSAAGIVLIFEDIHWIDPLSLNLLAAVIRIIEPLPLIVLLGYRPLDSNAAPLDHLGNVTELPLRVLSPAATSELIAAKARQLGQPPAEADLARLVEQVYARTQGNPFYIEELLIYLHANQEDLRDPQVWDRSELPTSLHQLLLSRMDQLSTAQQETLKIASVIGRLFRIDWLVGYQPALDTGSLAAELDTLRAAELIIQESAEPELAYLFRHVIAQEVAYESLAFSTRAQLHEQLGRYLENTGSQSDDKRIYLIAYHYERSANTEKQREYLLRAGAHAQDTYSNAAAIRYYQAALPLLNNDEVKGEVLIRIGKVLETVGDKPRALESYRAALGIVQSRPTDQLTFQAYYALGVFYCVDADYGKALEFLQSARSLALVHKPYKVASVDSQIGKVYFYQGRYDQAKAHLVKYVGNDDFSSAEASGYSATHMLLSAIALNQGDYRASYAYARRSLEINRKESDLLKYSDVLVVLGNALLNHADLQECLSLYEESLEIRRKLGARRAIAVALNNIALVQAKMFERETALQTYREALSIVTDIQEEILTLNITTQLGVVSAQLGRFAESKAYLSAAAALSDRIDLPLMRAYLYLGLATFHAQQGHFAEVEHFNRLVLAMDQENNNKTWMAISLSHLGSNCVDAGRLAEARPLLEQGLALAQEVDDKFLAVYVHYYLGFLALEAGNLADSTTIFQKTLALAQPIRHIEGYMVGLIGLASVRTQADPAPAAVAEVAAWMAVVERTLEQTRFNLLRTTRKWYDRLLEGLHSHLSAEQFAVAWGSGQGASLEQVVDQALAWLESA